jgi:hypothetical protein
MSRIKSLLVLLAVTAQVTLASAAITYAVGSCEPKLRSFTTIMGALGATPAPNEVEVCPGTYTEQVVITIPVTLKGISASNSTTGPTISSGEVPILANAVDDFGDLVAAQVLVENVIGEVNLTNLTVDGTLSGGTPFYVYFVGVFYQNSSGTVNSLFVKNHAPSDDIGAYGIWLEGGNANPSVTVENSVVTNFSTAGIYAETNSSTSELTATIKGNDVAFPYGSGGPGIKLVAGQTAYVSGNVVSGTAGATTNTGIAVDGGEGTVSNNKLIGLSPAIDVETDGVSVTSNAVTGFFAPGFNDTGIRVNSAVAPVTNNFLTQLSVGIDFNCTAGNNVHSNTIFTTSTGLLSVPTAAVTKNTIRNVNTIRGGCEVIQQAKKMAAGELRYLTTFQHGCGVGDVPTGKIGEIRGDRDRLATQEPRRSRRIGGQVGSTGRRANRTQVSVVENHAQWQVLEQNLERTEDGLSAGICQRDLLRVLASGLAVDEATPRNADGTRNVRVAKLSREAVPNSFVVLIGSGHDTFVI